MAYVLKPSSCRTYGETPFNTTHGPNGPIEADVGNSSIFLGTSPMSLSDQESSDLDFEEVVELFGDDHGPDRLEPTSDDFVTDVTKPVKIKIDSGNGDDDSNLWPLYSVPTLMRRQVDAFGDELALHGYDEDNRVRQWTFKQYADNVENFAKGLIALGLSRFGVVCVIGRNSPQWAIAALGTIHAGGVCAGLYDTDMAEHCRLIGELLKAEMFLVDDDKQAEKILSIRDSLPNLRRIIQGSSRPSSETVRYGVTKWADVLETGSRQSNVFLNERLQRMAINTCCMIICTSGSTGVPKAAMLTHDYCVMTAATVQKHAGAEMCKEVFISFMPLNHASGSIFELFSSLISASPMYFAPDALRGDLMRHLQRVRPTQMFAVPRHYEKLAVEIERVLDELFSGDKFLDMSRKATLEYHRARIDGTPTLEETEAYLKARRVHLDRLKAKAGLDRAKFVMVGGAPVHPQLVEFYLSLDIQLFQEYGMTESGATNIEYPTCFCPGSVGPVMDGHKVVVKKYNESHRDGEILFDGRIRFMGYAADDERTLEIIDDEGRLKSGDLGHFDAKGRLFVTGRIKELIVTSGGKKVSPRPIEVKLQQLLPPAVTSIMVVGEGRKFVSALFALKVVFDENGHPTDVLSEVTRNWVWSLGTRHTRVSSILQKNDKSVYAEIQKSVDGFNAKHASSSIESIKKWCLLPVEFSQASGELNNILKLKRSFIEQKYATEIDAMYRN